MNNTVNSSKWAFLNGSTQQIIGFVFFGGMTYLLSPKYFGIYAIGLIFSELFCQLARLGLSVNLINRKNNVNLALNNAFWSTLAVGFCIGIFFYCLSPYIAAYFNISANVVVIQLLAVVPFIFAIGCVPDALLQRKFLYKKIALATFIANATSCFLAFLVAFTDFKELAFALQKVMYECIMLFIIWYSIRWRPRLLINKLILKKQFKVGLPLLIAGLINVTTNKLKDIFIASVLGPATLGIYRLAVKLQDFVVKLALGPIVAVAIPSLARVKKEDFKKTVGEFMNWIAILSFPLFAGMAVTASELLSVLFNDNWNNTVLTLQMLCLLGAFSIYIHMFKPIFSVLEQGGWLVKLRVFHFFSLFVLLYFLSMYGIFYIILAEIIVTILITALGLSVLSYISNSNFHFIIFSVKPALIATCFMVVAVLYTKKLLYMYFELNNILMLMLLIVTGAVSYFISFKMFFNKYYNIAIKNIARGKLGTVINRFKKKT